LLRFYLLVLKASAYLNLRLANYSEAQSQLEKLIELDSQDYLRGKTLLKWLPTNETVIATEE
jgi:pantothenate kinase-related protein Tda10